jgi:hypothetical protein
MLGVAPEDYDLPHPAIGLPFILVVRRVLVHAFALLRTRHGALAGLKEDEITIALESIIENDLRQRGSVPGFNRQLFGRVVRQRQVIDYTFGHPAYTPDLIFHLAEDKELSRILCNVNGLFVECKPVDGAHHIDKAYCDEGIKRFVDGHYAWAMQEGLMLAYVRDGRTIAGHLVPAMRKASQAGLRTVELPTTTGMPGAGALPAAEALHHSRHRRGFPWPDGKGLATDITIYHLWHCCD